MSFLFSKSHSGMAKMLREVSVNQMIRNIKLHVIITIIIVVIVGDN